MHPDKDKWDRIYSGHNSNNEPQPAEVLLQNRHLFPKKGVALDLACGLGANSLLLAEQGLEVHAWDISSVAIERLDRLAKQRQRQIHTKALDVKSQPLESNSFDVLVVTHFLVREMATELKAALKPGGLLFYQTFCRDKVFAQGPSNPEYLLKDNELLQLFTGLKVRVYREESLLGDHDQGWRNQAMLVAEKPNGV
jgi:2-polyprenyl-3-methyl-5-hydroxy-6-metoxy-1,4-benzoquinol methylase